MNRIAYEDDYVDEDEDEDSDEEEQEDNWQHELAGYARY